MIWWNSVVSIVAAIGIWLLSMLVFLSIIGR